MRQNTGGRAVQVVVALGKSLCYVALFLGMQVLVMLPVMVAAGVAEAMGESGTAEELYSLIMDNAMVFNGLSGLLTIGVVLAVYLIRRKKLSEALWLRPVPAPTLWAGAALAPGLYLVVTTALALLPEEWLESYAEASDGIATGTLVGVVAVAVIAPVVEEVIFRGLIMTRLSRAVPGWLAVALSAAIFGICHGHPVWFAYAFVLGAVFGFIDLRAGSILPSILGHVAFNAIGQIFTFIPETEEGTELLIALGILLVVGVAAPVLNRKGVAALFRPAPKASPTPELPEAPRHQDYDPWDE